ncbi:MAG: c-type cytochrome domain-containing protein [bacterium]
MRRWLAPLPLLAMLTGCPGFGDKTLAELEGITDVPTWHADVQPIIARYCQPCHRQPLAGGAPFPLLTFEQVRDHADRVRVRAVQLGDMPPGSGGIPDTERALLDAWISGGMPEGEPTGPDMGLPDATPDQGPPRDVGVDGPTWDDDIGPLLERATCAQEFCHGGNPPSGGLDLKTYAGFVAGGFSGTVHGDGDPAEALIIDRMRARGGFTVMPLGGPARPEAEIALIEAWIAAGFPEN